MYDKGQGFISFEICPRKEKVTNRSREAFSKHVLDQWLRSPDRLSSQGAVRCHGLYGQTELGSNSRLIHRQHDGQARPSSTERFLDIKCTGHLNSQSPPDTARFHCPFLRSFPAAAQWRHRAQTPQKETSMRAGLTLYPQSPVHSWYFINE